MNFPSSFRSTQSVVVEGLRSYGRAQSFMTRSNIPSPADPFLNVDAENDESGDDVGEDGEYNEAEDTDENLVTDDSGPFHWDSDTSGSPVLRPYAVRQDSRISPPILSPHIILPHPNEIVASPTETSPLLRRPSISIQTPVKTLSSPRLHPRRSAGHISATSRRRLSQSSFGPHKREPQIGSTFGQSLFNSIAMLLGIGLLSEPFAFAQAGWVLGTVLTVGYGLLTCYTAKILAKIIYSDPRLRTYADISQKAFGPRATVFTSIFFCLELFTVCVVLVVLFSDSTQAVLPQFSNNTYKIMSLAVLIPSAFLPLSIISYTSLLSTIATLSIGVVLMVDGLSKHSAPGSLFDFAPTDLWPQSGQKLGLSFGLFMAGFAGHAVVPSIAKDMRHPEEFDRMINCAFVITSFVYAAVGACGYLMFGRTVSDEFSQDLIDTPGYNPNWAKVGLWMLIISPLTKFALSSRPMNLTLEVLLNIDPFTRPTLLEHRSSSSLPEDFGIPERSTLRKLIDRHSSMFRSAVFLRAVERIVLILLIIGVAIAVPQFGVVMGLLGAFSSFTLCVIGPLAAKLTINGANGWTGIGDWCLLIVSVVMGVWGTVSCVWSQVKAM